MDFQTLLLFIIASLSINLIPGPDVIFIVSNTLKGKLRLGMLSALGLGTGYLIHTFAAVLGLSTIVLNSAFLFGVVKFLGAAYLIYLAMTSLKNFATGKSALLEEPDQTKQGNVFVQGIVVSVLNPKVALFFLSFLPQFVDPASGQVTGDLLILGLVFCFTATCCNLFYAITGNVLLNKAKGALFTRFFEGLAGILLLGLGAKVALE